MFSKLSFANVNLAASTHRASTADRVNIHPQLTGSLQQVCASRDLPLPARGGENYFYLF